MLMPANVPSTSGFHKLLAGKDTILYKKLTRAILILGTWKTVEELSPQELSEVELATDTPRSATIPYMPAEAYPFTAPYTAEEMGYRLMEFSQRPRWSCMFANLWGSITPQGVF